MRARISYGICVYITKKKKKKDHATKSLPTTNRHVIGIHQFIFPVFSTITNTKNLFKM